MQFLIDTHLALWWQGMREKVPRVARDLIEVPENDVFVSRVSLWEMAIKVNQGNLKLDLARFCARMIEDGFAWLPIENEHILQLAELPTFADHKDPFDRLLVAQSRSEPLILLTRDARLTRYGTTIRVV